MPAEGTFAALSRMTLRPLGARQRRRAGLERSGGVAAESGDRGPSGYVDTMAGLADDPDSPFAGEAARQALARLKTVLGGLAQLPLNACEQPAETDAGPLGDALPVHGGRARAAGRPAPGRRRRSSAGRSTCAPPTSSGCAISRRSPTRFSPADRPRSRPRRARPPRRDGIAATEPVQQVLVAAAGRAERRKAGSRRPAADRADRQPGGCVRGGSSAMRCPVDGEARPLQRGVEREPGLVAQPGDGAPPCVGPAPVRKRAGSGRPRDALDRAGARSAAAWSNGSASARADACRPSPPQQAQGARNRPASGWPRRARLIWTMPSDDIGWISTGAGSPRNAFFSASSSRWRSGRVGRSTKSTMIVPPRLRSRTCRAISAAAARSTSSGARPPPSTSMATQAAVGWISSRPPPRQRHLAAQSHLQRRVDVGLREGRLVRRRGGSSAMGAAVGNVARSRSSSSSKARSAAAIEARRQLDQAAQQPLERAARLGQPARLCALWPRPPAGASASPAVRPRRGAASSGKPAAWRRRAKRPSGNSSRRALAHGVALAPALLQRKVLHRCSAACGSARSRTA